MTEWSQGNHISLVKNPNYWVSGRPYLDAIETPIIKDPQAMIVQLEAGAIDVADQPPIREFNRLKTDAAYQALVNPNDGQHVILAPNTTVAPFDNKLVRQALRYAIDRQRMNEVALLGLATRRRCRGCPARLPTTAKPMRRIRPRQGRGATQGGGYLGISRWTCFRW